MPLYMCLVRIMSTYAHSAPAVHATEQTWKVSAKHWRPTQCSAAEGGEPGGGGGLKREWWSYT